MKRCFKCGLVKESAEFYRHSEMADGLLGKCKGCTKKDVAERVAAKRLDPVWLTKERARCREKTQKARVAGTFIQSSPEVRKRWAQRNRHKRRAEQLASNAQKKGLLKKPETCQRCHLKTEALSKHHPDYSLPTTVQWLCSACHGFVHRKVCVP